MKKPERRGGVDAFTSKEVITILNGGCLCTLGRGPCQKHADPEPTGNDGIEARLSRPLGAVDLPNDEHQRAVSDIATTQPNQKGTYS